MVKETYYPQLVGEAKVDCLKIAYIIGFHQINTNSLAAYSIMLELTEGTIIPDDNILNKLLEVGLNNV